MGTIGSEAMIMPFSITDMGEPTANEREQAGEITEYKLQQNYPNPFNPVTQIEYQLPTASTVSFKVFDMMGREVYNLRNQQKAAGFYTIDFDASNLSSGIYIYQLRAGEFIQTKKMTLIK